jgi:hypothetical protein
MYENEETSVLRQKVEYKYFFNIIRKEKHVLIFRTLIICLLISMRFFLIYKYRFFEKKVSNHQIVYICMPYVSYFY